MNVGEAWTRLHAVTELAFQSRSQVGWSGSGQGSVRVESVDDVTMLYHEQGKWTLERGTAMLFRNLFRWTLDAAGQFLRLEHLRFGPEHPVYLFNLVPMSLRLLVSSQPHVCGEDRYAVRLEYDEDEGRLTWTIIGPRKDERIEYRYRRGPPA